MLVFFFTNLYFALEIYSYFFFLKENEFQKYFYFILLSK